jgi:nitronate monooxygenase
MTDSDFTRTFSLKLPVIMAPMFLVSDLEMMKAAIRNGVLGVFPSLNYKNTEELESVLKVLSEYQLNYNTGNYGVNLIVQKTNPLIKKHLNLCLKHRVPFYITSLGNPELVIEGAHEYGGKVYCDVTNMEHAYKCAKLNCDGFIAVGNSAGGHAGPYPLNVIVPELRKEFPSIPVIAAGGIADGQSMASAMLFGASGVSIGTRFIASQEAPVSDAYKQAIVKAGKEDIVMTERLSGTPCAVINTPYVKEQGLKQSFAEKILSRSPLVKKYFKMLVQIKGLKHLKKSVKSGNYKNIWSAGQSVELIDEVLSIEQIVNKLQSEYNSAIIN